MTNAEIRAQAKIGPPIWITEGDEGKRYADSLAFAMLTELKATPTTELAELSNEACNVRDEDYDTFCDELANFRDALESLPFQESDTEDCKLWVAHSESSYGYNDVTVYRYRGVLVAVNEFGGGEGCTAPVFYTCKASDLNQLFPD